ncbi:DedA family protein [Wolbachia endosymbiont of Pentidionis agamae]|uniref:DedA family protein n=1 Tax=Wolbachia endosymbiont of Pentidionis agamae TaxID=3110435 RepID=UPI002FD3CCBF
MGNYFSLFADNFVSALIIPISQPFIFNVMLSFKEKYSLFFILFFGLLGSCLGGIINLFIGRTIAFTRQCLKSQKQYVLSKLMKNTLILVVALFSWIPVFGSTVQVVAGYLRLNILIFTLSTILSNLLYLSYLISTY